MEHWTKSKPKQYQVEVTGMVYHLLEVMADKYKTSVEQLANEAILEYFSDEIDDSRNQRD